MQEVNKLDLNEVNNLKLHIECSLIKKKPTWCVWFRVLIRNSLKNSVHSRYDVFAYSYCYIGILTGPYFKYRTYKDWIEMKYGNKVCLNRKNQRIFQFFNTRPLY